MQPYLGPTQAKLWDYLVLVHSSNQRILYPESPAAPRKNTQITQIQYGRIHQRTCTRFYSLLFILFKNFNFIYLDS